MAIVTYVPDPNRPYRMSDEERARLDALTDEEITAAAESDPDNPPLTAEEFQRIHAIQDARAARARTGLSWTDFAHAYGIEPAQLEHLEQGRLPFDPILGKLLALIADDPERAARLLRREPDLEPAH